MQATTPMKLRGILLLMQIHNRDIKVLLDTGAQANFIGKKMLQYFKPIKQQTLSSPLKALTASNITHVITEMVTIQLPSPFSSQIEFYILDHLPNIIIGKPTLQLWCYTITPDGEQVIINNKKITLNHHSFIPCQRININPLLQPDEIKAYLLETYPRLFDITPREAQDRNFKYHLVTSDETPIHLRAYPSGPDEKRAIEKFIQTNLEAKVICKGVPNSWVSPIFAIKQKDKFRIVCDLRKLNAKTLPEPTYLFTIKDLIVALSGARYFTVLDLKSAFFQISVTEPSVRKLGIICHLGIFNFRRLPFGARNAPFILTNFIQSIIREHDLKNVFIYMDDLLLYTKNKEEHLQLLLKICSILDSHGLQINVNKIQILQTEVTFLGYIISHDSIRPTEDKIRAISNWSLPRTTTEVRSMLNFTNYFHNFIPNLATYTAKLTPLYANKGKQVKIEHTEETRQAFEQLKKHLINIPSLYLFDSSIPVHIFVDTLDQAIGGILTQVRERDGKELLVPIAFGSYILSDVQKRYSSMEKELLGILTIIQKFSYTLTSKICVYTDHQSLATLRTKSEQPPLRVARFLDYLGAFAPDIYYLPGTKNYLADILSRHQTSHIKETTEEAALLNQDVFTVTHPSTLSASAISLDNLDDTQLQKIKSHLQEIPTILATDSNSMVTSETSSDNEQLPIDQFTLIDNDLYVRQGLRMVKVVSSEDFLDAAKRIHERHHASIRITDFLTTKTLWHPDHLLLITSLIRHCNFCQIHHYFTDVVRELTVLPPCNAFSRWFMDFTLAPVPDDDQRFILTAIEAVSGLAYAIPVRSADTSAVTALLLLIIQVHNVPAELITDNGTAFVSAEALEFYNNWKISKHNTSNYHSQSNGKIEKFHDQLKRIMRGLTRGTWSDWSKNLPLALHIYNSTPSVFGKSPYYLAYGIENSTTANTDNYQIPDFHDDDLSHSSLNTNDPDISSREYQEEHDNFILRLHQIDILIKDREEHNQLKRRRDAMHNLLREPYGRQATFTKGQWIYKRNKKHKKSDPNFDGPFQVEKVLDHGAYILKDAAGNVLKGTHNRDKLTPCFSWENGPIHALSQYYKSLKEVEGKLLHKMMREQENSTSNVNVLTLKDIKNRRRLLDLFEGEIG